MLLRCNETTEDRVIVEDTGYEEVTMSSVTQHGVSVMELKPEIFSSGLIIPNINLKIQHLSGILRSEIEQGLYSKLLMMGKQESFWQLKQDLRKQTKNMKLRNNHGPLSYIFACPILVSIVVIVIIVGFQSAFKKILAKTPETVRVRLVSTGDTADEPHAATIAME